MAAVFIRHSGKAVKLLRLIKVRSLVNTNSAVCITVNFAISHFLEDIVQDAGEICVGKTAAGG